MYDNWKSLNDECTQCTKCDLSQTRTNVVIGRGNTDAKVMLIGEGPGEQEDMSGKPFVGAAGKLLDVLLEALMFKPDSYYIANIVKCRPPKNRVPSDAEAEECLPYLRNQVMLIKPKIIVCLGAVATKYIIDKDAKITRIRGNWIERNKFAILPTFHPAALLRDESKKEPMWNDFVMLRDKMKEVGIW